MNINKYIYQNFKKKKNVYLYVIIRTFIYFSYDFEFYNQIASAG